MSIRLDKLDKLANYKNPPLFEVVLGVRFELWKDWKAPHSGLFWNKIYQDFPNCQHASPVAPINTDESGLPFPRIWLINKSDDRLIQLQPDRFLFNWRNTGFNENYPHFKDLWSNFLHYFNLYIEFCEEYNFGTPNILEFELTYINHIYDADRWNFPHEFDGALRGMVWSDKSESFLPRPDEINWQAKFSLPKSYGSLSVKMNPGTRRSDGRKLLVLELTAKGQPPETPLESLEDWFGTAHEWIVHGFEDLTTDTAQTDVWGKNV